MAAKEKVDFQYEGTDRSGNKVKGDVQAVSELMAKGELRKMGINPLRVKKKPKPLFGGGPAKITPTDIAIFTRQLSTMLRSGVPLVQSFDIIGEGSENSGMKKVISEIKNDIEGGSNLSEALRKHPEEFDDLFTNLIEAGEQSGALETMLDKLATYKEKTEALKKKIKKALTYPISVLVVAFAVTVILLVFVVPQFEAMFQDFGADLPGMTKMVISMSEFMQAWWYIIVGVIVGLVMAMKQVLKRSPPLQRKMEFASLKYPVVGDILVKSAIARFARTLETMSVAGVPLVEAMESVAGATGNAKYAEGSMRIKDDISTGTALMASMRTSELFPNMVIQMVGIGEEAGSLDAMLGKVADFYEDEVDNAVDNLTSLMEPIIMSVLGVLVGGLIISMYLPIFKLGSVV